MCWALPEPGAFSGRERIHKIQCCDTATALNNVGGGGIGDKAGCGTWAGKKLKTLGKAFPRSGEQIGAETLESVKNTSAPPTGVSFCSQSSCDLNGDVNQ